MYNNKQSHLIKRLVMD